MKLSFEERIAAVDWANYDTAYGRTDEIPNQLLRLASRDKPTALKASHDLWCALCHQHVQVATAALPALPFLLEVLATADELLAPEILDIILGFAKGVNRQRRSEYLAALGRKAYSDPEWVIELRARLGNESGRFTELGSHSNANIAELANSIVQELSETVQNLRSH